jgi:hypothetical protein
MSPAALLSDIWNTVADLQDMRADDGDWEHLTPSSSGEELQEVLSSTDMGSAVSDSEMEELDEVLDN